MKAIDAAIKAVRKKHIQSRWYTKQLKSLLGNTWAMYYVITGGRMTGKSYALTDFLCNQKKKKGDQVKNYWLRISQTSTKFMLANKAQKLVDPDLVRKYNLDLSTKGMQVFDHGKPFMTVMPLSSMGKMKGVALYDKDFTGWINIVLDEFQLEQGQKRTSFSILYNFMGMLQNIVRTTKSRLRIFLVGNTLQEASSILKAFDFLPQNFGRFYLKRKRCIIDNLEPTQEYLKDRYGSAADILGGASMSNYTNQLSKDTKLITKQRVHNPQYVIMFGKTNKDKYLVWQNNIITKYKGQPVNECIPMRAYQGLRYDTQLKKHVFEIYDSLGYKFDSLITKAYFEEELQKLRK